ncbi:ABC transporter substrate-binding protein [Xylophilus rhododendri]|uniref:ABC transporter substrate-binding protein n=2 Tax=Xylophilus rhododendri TaxID=2697032 RepID=A0A857JEG9_9BURK|nr:ABC transporter substrate-binding protein [Xylophilus rhododendri]
MKTIHSFVMSAVGLAALCASPAFAQQATFQVGALTPVTGAGAPYGAGMSKAIEIAVAEINAAGGAKGAKLVVSSEDSQTAPQAAVLGAKKLLSVSNVKALIGVWSSGESLAVMPLTNEANVLLMHASGAPALSGPPVNDKKLGFRFQATNGRFGRAFAEIAKREGYTKPATMAFNNASGLGNTEGFATAWKAAGKEVVASVVYEPNRPSYRSELQSVLRAKPDVIVTGSYLADTTIILREWYQSGVNTKWIIPGWAANADLIKALGPEVTEGIISVETVSNEAAPSYKHYAEAAGKAGINVQGNAYAAMAYDQAIILGLAVQAAGPTASGTELAKKVHEIGTAGGTQVYTFAEGKKKLEAGERVSYIGASSALNFDEFNDVTPDFAAWKIEKGQLVRKYIVKL